MSERANQLAESDDKIKHQFGAALFSSLFLASAQSRGTCFHPSKHPSIHPFVHSFVNSLPGGDGDNQRRLALGIVSIFGPSQHLESAAERDSADWRSINQRARKFSHSLRFSRARARLYLLLIIRRAPVARFLCACLRRLDSPEAETEAAASVQAEQQPAATSESHKIQRKSPSVSYLDANLGVNQFSPPCESRAGKRAELAEGNFTARCVCE